MASKAGRRHFVSLVRKEIPIKPMRYPYTPTWPITIFKFANSQCYWEWENIGRDWQGESALKLRRWKAATLIRWGWRHTHFLCSWRNATVGERCPVQQDIYKNVYRDIVPNSPKLETPKCPPDIGRTRARATCSRGDEFYQHQDTSTQGKGSLIEGS